MRIIDRFDKYMIYKKINDNQVTVNCGLSVGLLGKARRGDCDLGKKAVEKILNFYTDINRVWLLTGEGEMLKPSAPSITETPQRNWTPAPNYACESGSVYERIRDLEEKLRLNDLAIKEKDAQIKRQEDLINKLFDLVKKLNDK